MKPVRVSRDEAPAKQNVTLGKNDLGADRAQTNERVSDVHQRLTDGAIVQHGVEYLVQLTQIVDLD